MQESHFSDSPIRSQSVQNNGNKVVGPNCLMSHVREILRKGLLTAASAGLTASE